MSEEKPQQPIRVLVVDDEEGMRQGCLRALQPAGYAVDLAESVTAARRKLPTAAYDLYLIDVMLPDGSGLDLIGPILKKDPWAICIIITGFGSVEMAVQAVRLGAYDFLSKPFTSDRLLITVAQGLERRRLKRVEADAQRLIQERAEMERLDQIKSQLMLKVAHELRAPTAAVQSYINLILGGHIDEDELDPILRRVQQRLQEMLDLTADLLELSRLKQTKDKITQQASPQPMANILREVCDLLRPQADAKHQSMRVKIADEPIVVGRPEHFQAIWMNLLSNAIKYTPENGRISVALRTRGDRVIGSVEDTGIGMTPDDLKHLFQEFFRTDAAKATGEIGTGLGLSIVKQIIDSYGGEISAKSQSNQGTCFVFSLPLEPRQKVDTAAAEESELVPLEPSGIRLPPASTHTRAILVGDD